MVRAAIAAAMLGAAAGLAPGAGVLFARPPSPENAVTERAVTIDDFTFAPDRLTVAAGTTLTWTNRDDIPHTVAAVGRLFRSKALDTGDHYSFTFTMPGTYPYFCSLHPHMTGMIVVEAASGDAGR